MKPTVFITGGAGYIGSHVAKCLHRAGWNPVTYDNFRRGHREAVKWGPLVEGELLDGARLADALSAWRPAMVVHCAALAYVGESAREPGTYYANNVTGTLTLLEAMRLASVDRLVFSSTCAVYGVPEAGPVREDSPRNPVNPYGRSKLAAESVIGDFEAAYGMRAVCLRYFNAAGCDPEGEIGESHDPETHLIPLALEAAANPEVPLHVLGTDYPTPDGTCIRDYVHVADLAEGHRLAIEHLMDGGAGDRINLGYGEGRSVLDIVKGVERVTGRTVAMTSAPRRPGDPPVLVGDATRAGRVLGWRPRHAALDDILETAWRWHRNRSY